ncbi:10280_t:CDS:2 [Funneliformis geosporum]|uniref:17256_t:CDS:1 n=1 Tax=Funneliformis geosporum TaxID=1117311 RepID=A0A9W4SG94_9GLOM|nr:17256_t:CDS:2 [Funneliformis geosporum]CAI2169107.1 10280_t:CDS:2 [Funneliformis geosporum]
MAVAQDHWAAKWIADSDGKFPANSFWEGDHAIGRAYFKEGLHVGYVVQGKGLVIGWGGKEHIISHYEVLTGDKSHFHWVLCHGACRPQNFIPLKGGFESDGKELYIGRVSYNGKDRIGKAGQHLIDGMNFAVDGRETSYPDYYVFAFRT